MTNFDYVANVHKISCYMNSILSIFEANKIATQMETEEMMFWKCILYGTTFFFSSFQECNRAIQSHKSMKTTENALTNK